MGYAAITNSLPVLSAGLNILSLNNDIGETGGVQVYSGTSMAAPHVTAAAAMVLSVLSATRNR